MIEDNGQRLARLRAESVRMEELLAGNAAWRSFTSGAVDGGTADPEALAALERELSHDPLFIAHRGLQAAIAALTAIAENQPAAASSQTPDRAGEIGPALAEPLPVEPLNGANTPEAVAAPATGEGEVSEAATAVQDEPTVPDTPAVVPHIQRRVGLLPVGGRASTIEALRAATIHRGPPGGTAGHASDRSRAPDDLTRIRGVDRGLAQGLIKRGVKTFAQIAAFSAADVKALSAALGLGTRISQQNWIEQAAVLHRRFGAAAGQEPIAPAEDGTLDAPPPPLEPSDIVARVALQLAARLNQPVEVAQASPEPAALETEAAALEPAEPGVNELLAEASRPDNAAVAASETDESGAEGEPLPGIAAASAAAAATAWLTAGSMIAEVNADDGLTQHGSDAGEAVPAAEAETNVADTAASDVMGPELLIEPSDDLEMISGIGPELARELYDLGVHTYEEIATWTSDDVAVACSILQDRAAIGRDQWIEQAAVLAAGGTTAYARRRARGEAVCLSPRPASGPARDDSFAGWLEAHSQSLAPAEPQVEPPAFSSPLQDAEATAVETTAHDAVAETDIVPPEAEPAPAAAYGSPDVVAAAAAVAAALAATRLPVAQSGEPGMLLPARFDDPSWPPPLPDGNPVVGSPILPYLPGEEPTEIRIPSGAYPPPLAGAEQGGASDDHETEDGDPSSPHHTSIADRITAIERDLAGLSHAERRLAVAPPARAASPAPTAPTADLVPNGVPPAKPRVEERSVEADVTIVQRPASEIGLDPIPERVPDGGDEGRFGGQTYAAYRDRVEEASVEIVPVWHTPVPAAGDGTVVGSDGTLSRFLKALRGR
ncbi:MAG: helix-hairpin-helix domain-containing protein [Hyphomicrobiaceae bacterium]